MMTKQSHAIVIGGSIAGMLAARVLSERFDRVTILDRDEIVDSPEARNGVPQGRHLHLLLETGQRIMEELFPTLGDDLSKTGAPVLHWGMDTVFVSPGGESSRFHSGICTHLTSRISLEYLIRQRLNEISNIEWRLQNQVDSLIHENGTVLGVTIRSRKNQETESLLADLVVDASGRESKSPEWLQALGYEAPTESNVDAFIGYATRWYELPEGFKPDWKSIAISTNIPENNLRAGAMFLVEGNKAVVTLQGTNKDYPPTDDDAYLAFAKTLQAPQIYDFIKQAKPTSPIYGYRRTHNRIRHYEKLSRHPENFLVMGDAYCAFNPIYGQGMTTAAMEAMALRDVLKAYSLSHLEGFASKFQKVISKVIESPWLMATSEDLRYPLTEGGEVTPLLRVMQVYSGWLTEVTAHDTVLGQAFVEMMNLRTTGTDLLRPNIVARVLWHKFIRPKVRREPYSIVPEMTYPLVETVA
jgi:2-polyprenyl-6-methoxyphenol hydroxylase-like FAD-dependent oxidoreductase